MAHILVDTRIVELKKITSSWDRERYVRENDWAKFGKESNSLSAIHVRSSFTSLNPKLVISGI